MRRTLIISLFLISATLAVFWQVHDHEFTNYDDHIYVTENIHVVKGLTAHGVIWAFTTTHAANWHPLTWLSHMLDCQLYGLKPGGHHLTSVILHLANVLLLFFLLRKMTGALWRSGFAAALFALHPLHVESVAWVAERKDVLSAFFWMLTLWGYTLYVQQPRLRTYLLTILTCALGLMAKPMLVTLPFVMILLDYWPFGRLQIGRWAGETSAPLPPTLRNGEAGSFSLHLFWEKIPFLALAAASSIVTYLAQQTGGAFQFGARLTLKTRLANALVSYVHYLGKMFWPQNLAAFYPHPGDTLPIWLVVSACLLLLCLTSLTILTARKYPYLVVGWLWYFGTLVPVIGLVQVGDQALADRYTYVPLIGLFVSIAWGANDLLAKYHYRTRILAIASSAVISSLLVCTWSQVSVWKNAITLFNHSVRVTASNWLAHNNLGVALVNNGKLDEATSHFLEAVRIKPSYAEAYNNLGNVFAEQGKLDEAVAHFSQVLRALPDSSEAHNNLAVVLVRQGRYEEATHHYSEAARLKPDSAEVHNNLGVALANLGRVEEATSHYVKAVQLKPSYAEAYNNLGNALADQAKLPEAILYYSKALEIDPRYAKAHNNMGVARARQGRLDEAIAHFEEALRLKPDFGQARMNLNTALREAGRGTIEWPSSLNCKNNDQLAQDR